MSTVTPPDRQLSPSAEPRTRPRWTRSWTRLRASTLIAAALGAGFGASALARGFYFQSVWGWLALGMLAVLLASGLTGRRPDRLSLLAIGGVAAISAWSYASIAWAESVDQALEEGNRWLLYAAVLTVLVRFVDTARAARLVIGCAAAGVVAVSAYIVVKMLTPGAPSLFLGPRLNEPLKYINGQAAYFLMAFWPLVALAERARRVVVSAAAAGLATVLAGLVVLTQTRAAMPAAVLAAVVLLVALPGRLRRAWILLAVVGGVAAIFDPLLDVYQQGLGKPAPPTPTIRTAGLLILAVAALVAAGWAVADTLGRRVVAAKPHRRRTLRLAAGAAPLAIVAVGLVAGLVALGDPIGRVEREAANFTQLRGEERGSRFLSGGGNRYDYWRIAVDQFSDRPLLGVGAGNYDRTYFRERRTTENIRQPHSIELQTLAELGIVGGVALGLFLVSVLVAFGHLVKRARVTLAEVGLAVAAGGAFITWLAHTSIDWLHLIPGLTGVALVAAAALLAGAAPPGTVSAPHRSDARAVGWLRRRRRPVAFAAAGAAVLLIAVGAMAIGRQTLSDTYRARAERALAEDPRLALERSATALALNPHNIEAHYAQAAAYARFNRYEEARATLLEAARREPHEFVTWALLGDLATRRGDAEQARRAYARAAALNPRDQTLAELAKAPPGTRTP